MERPLTVVLGLEHRGNSHLTFAEPVSDAGDSGVSVVIEHKAWLLMGGPAELQITLREPQRDVLPVAP